MAAAPAAQLRIGQEPRRRARLISQGRVEERRLVEPRDAVAPFEPPRNPGGAAACEKHVAPRLEDLFGQLASRLAAAGGRCALWYPPEARTTRFAPMSPDDVRRRKDPFSAASRRVTVTPSRTGARKLSAYVTRCRTISFFGMNPSGSSPR